MYKKFFLLLTSIILSISLLAACSGEGEPGFEEQPGEYMDNNETDAGAELDLDTTDDEFGEEEEEEEAGE
ncbi:hypothetical protein [Anaerobacillus alkaliphilus]|uniref:hypothetical protein n=1 Tax=Anaerobacillus alkaliphilus TaxID=1548597 RepID=UPI00100B8BE2|nr:hypothetical protein [Anaerobacillus alkaliphilus]